MKHHQQHPPIDVGSQLQKVNAKLPLEVAAFSTGLSACKECERTSSFTNLATAYLSLAEARMSTTQKIVLKSSVQMLTSNELTLTSLADKVSRKTGVPYSTVKWNVRVLVNLGLLNGGDIHRRGKLASFTTTADMLVRYLEHIEKNEL